MIRLSHSTLKMLYEHPHCWLNRQMKAVVPDNPYFKRGHRLQDLITAHLNGKKVREDLKHIHYSFPTLELVDFDPNCKISFPINDKYEMIGYLDGANYPDKISLEIKTSTKMWSLNDFNKAMQRRIYNIAFPFTENVLITAIADENLWHIEPPKVFSIPVTEQDKQECWDWIHGGIKILEEGDFTKDLVDGKCVDRFCLYGVNCQFK